MEPHLQLERFPPQVGLKPVTTRSVGQLLTKLSRLLSGGKVYSLNKGFNAYYYTALLNIEIFAIFSYIQPDVCIKWT